MFIYVSNQDQKFFWGDLKIWVRVQPYYFFDFPIVRSKIKVDVDLIVDGDIWICSLEYSVFGKVKLYLLKDLSGPSPLVNLFFKTKTKKITVVLYQKEKEKKIVAPQQSIALLWIRCSSVHLLAGKQQTCFKLLSTTKVSFQLYLSFYIDSKII